MRVDYKVKLKVKEFCDKFINADNIKVFLLAVPLSVVLIERIHDHKFTFSNYLDVNILVSFLVVFFCEIIARALSNYIVRKTEDVVKLTKDYKALVYKYSRAPLYQHFGKGKKVIFPSIVISIRGFDEYTLEFDDSNYDKHYELPKQIADDSLKLMDAHSKSVVYNSQTLRIDALSVVENCVKITYSRTTYFDTLLTNRVMDYAFKGGKSIREIYEPGPFFSSLEDSKFSNHLGYIGFVEIADGKIIFIKRSDKVSTAKEQWQPSVSASYKVKFGLEDDQTLSERAISCAIREEIKDELAISVADTIPLDETIIGFYRDLVEGGKPHFVFYYKDVSIAVDVFEANFKKMVSSKKAGDVTIDGTVAEMVDKTDLLNAVLDIGSFEMNGCVYSMDASMMTALAIWIDHNRKIKV